MTLSKANILIVEDERIVADDIKMGLQRLGYTISGIVISGEEAVKKAEEALPDLVLMDIVIEGEMDGIEAAAIIRSRFHIPVVYLTAYAEKKMLERAKLTEPFGYVLKPFEDRDLYTTIEIALYRHKMENMLKESEERYRVLFEESRDAIYISTRDGKFVDFNQTMQDLFGYTRKEARGMDVQKICVNITDWIKLQEQIEKKGFVRDHEVKLCNKDAKEMDCLLTSTVLWASDGTLLGYQGSIRDISVRKHTEKELIEAKDEAEKALKKLKKAQFQLIQSERLAALGRLSAGVAHEINNPLSIISGHAQMLSMDDNVDSSEVKETSETIKKQVDRASRITDQLLKFSKRTKPELKELDVNEIINSTLSLLEHQLTQDNIKVVRGLSSKPISIRADPSQLQQVFLNLIINASTAMPDGGKLTISTKDAGANVEINFTDTGCGIPKQNLNKVFEPFFSTREEGSGLGLSIVYGIIQAHQGSIKVRSKERKGTTFIITLPAKKNFKVRRKNGKDSGGR